MKLPRAQSNQLDRTGTVISRQIPEILQNRRPVLATSLTDIAEIGDPARGTRLDSWKEIAAYLRKSEKTVRRWETERGLPIHRAPGARRTAVYAFTGELHQWLLSGRSEDQDPARTRALPSRSTNPAPEATL